MKQKVKLGARVGTSQRKRLTKQDPLIINLDLGWREQVYHPTDRWVNSQIIEPLVPDDLQSDRVSSIS